jgi:IS5 family transposase
MWLETMLRVVYVKTRFQGLAKNRAQLFTLSALGNPFLVRRRLMT